MTDTTSGGPDPAPLNPAVVDGVDVDVVAAAVAACAGVSGLYGGRFGDVASYLPGRRVPGVIVDAGAVRVEVRSRWGVPAADLFAQIRSVLAPVLSGHRLDVVVADVDDPPSLDAPTPLALEPGSPESVDDPPSSDHVPTGMRVTS